MPQVLCCECAFRRWVWALELHDWLLVFARSRAAAKLLPMDPMAMDHAGRFNRLQSILPESKLDFLLITHLPNVRYLSGFTGSAAALLVGEQGATLFTDGRYIAQAKQEVTNARIVIGNKAPALVAAESLGAERARTASRPSSRALGIEAESLTAGARAASEPRCGER